MVSLDTTFVVDFLTGYPAAVERFRRLESDRSVVCISPSAVAETLVGASGGEPRHLRAAEEFLRSLNWLEFDWESCRLAGRIGSELSSRGEPLSAADLFIAAVSLRHGHSLLTRDRAFARVRGLSVETY